jgi:hypothetical protein
MRGSMRHALLAGVLFAALGYLYLLPASRYLVRGDSSWLLTDGGDAVSAPTMYWGIIDATAREPSRLLYGTVYTELLNPPDGWGLWFAWQDRLLVLAAALVGPLEAVPTFVSWALMVANGLALYAFGRVEGWRRSISLALGIAFAFSVYTRARAFVHPGLVGLYALPLAFVALRLAQRARRARDLILPTVVFLVCATCSHYYVIMIAAVSPLLLWFYLRGLPSGERLRGLRRLAIAAAPAVIFLGWNLAVTAPPAVRARAVYRPPIITSWLSEFGARPSDYLVGDIAVAKDPTDWNPLRRVVNGYAQRNVAPSNPHERSNGIRWLVLAAFLALAAAMIAPKLRRRLPSELRREAFYYLVFAGCMFLLSLPPSLLHLETDLGPSRLVHAIFPNFRIPCRFGAFAHFGVLAAVGWGVHSLLERARVWDRPRARWAVAALLPLLVIADYPPALALPVRRLAPAITPVAQAAEGAECGTGLFFPYSAANPYFAHEIELYRSFQRIRGTSCRPLNSPGQTPLSQRLIAVLGFDAYAAKGQQRRVEDGLVGFARCARVDWIVFESVVPAEARGRICGQLGGVRVADDACRLPGASNRLVPVPLECLPP